MEKIVKIHTLKEHDSIAEDLKYWLSKTPQERLSAVEILRRQYYGDTARLQRVLRIVKREKR